MAQNKQYRITIRLDGEDKASDDLKRVNRGLKTMRTESKRTAFSLDGFNSVLGQVGIGLSALGIARAVIDLNQLGIEVGAIKTTFEQMSGGAMGAATSLERMRAATGNIIDDMTLMAGANSLLVTGLAQTNEEASRLVELGARLGQAMGVEAADSINNLNAAILNSSFARLDTLGISASVVRERVNELKKAGLDMQQAFAQAVLEEGTRTVEKLGVAAASSETSVNRLATSFKNMTQDLGEFMARGVEAGSQLLELAGIFISAAASDVQDFFDDDDIKRTAVIVGNFQSMAEMQANIANFDPPTFAEAALQTGQMATDFEMMAQMSGIVTHDVSSLPSLSEMYAGQDLTQFFDRFNEFLTLPSAAGAATISDIPILDPANYKAIEFELFSIEALFTDIQVLAQDGLITDDQLADAQNMVNAVQNIAGAAAEAAANFENMNLAQLLGAEGGGRLGELSDLVMADLAQIEDQEFVAKIKFQFDLRTGRTTALQQAFESEFSDILARMATDLGPEIAGEAMEQVLAVAERGQLLGISDVDLIGVLRNVIGFKLGDDEGGDAQTVTIEPGDSLWALARANDTTVEQLVALNQDIQSARTVILPGQELIVQPRMGGLIPIEGGGGLPPWFGRGGVPIPGGDEGGLTIETTAESVSIMREDFEVIADTDFTTTLSPLQSDLDIADDTVKSMKNQLESLANTEYRANFFLDMAVADETGLNLARAPWFAAAIEFVAINNGGVLPGTSG